MTLRGALQEIEKTGLVEYSLGGHTCGRPAEVKQGRADPGNPLLWRSNAVQTKSLKSANLAGHFSWEILKTSPLKLVFWKDWKW